MQANQIMRAIITGCGEANSLTTAQMMSALGESALDMYPLS